MSLQECLRQQTLDHLGKAATNQGQEHTGYHNVVTRLRHASHFPATEHGHCAWNVTHRHLVAVLLNFKLLELDEFRAARLQVQSAASLVHPTVIRRAIMDRGKGERVHGLVSLRAATIACIGGHHHHGLHLCAAGDDAANGDQLSNVLRLHLTYGVRLFRRLWLEAYLTRGKRNNTLVLARKERTPPSTHNRFISSAGKQFRSSRCSMGFRVRASIINRCSMYTSRASLACTSCCL